MRAAAACSLGGVGARIGAAHLHGTRLLHRDPLGLELLGRVAAALLPQLGAVAKQLGLLLLAAEVGRRPPQALEPAARVAEGGLSREAKLIVVRENAM